MYGKRASPKGHHKVPFDAFLEMRPVKLLEKVALVEPRTKEYSNTDGSDTEDEKNERRPLTLR
jgi:hypothetical protein